MDYGTPIEEIECSTSALSDYIYSSETPIVLRGLVNEWPIVKKSKESNEAVIEYLNRFYNGKPVNAFLAEPETQGRIFYNDSVDGFNFAQSQVYLDDVLNRLNGIANQQSPPTFYVGSLEINQHLPGFALENELNLKFNDSRIGIWLGNHSIVAPHFDFPDNLACCVIGERRFTLFPPEQHQNLYVGPLDFTPAGQPISMVDIKHPDLQKFPRFEAAMEAAKTTKLQQGDAIFIPSMWWHSVESLSVLNGLVNYWWRDSPAYLGVPNTALLHAIMSIKALPKRQRDAWKSIFTHYVFDQPSDMYDHLPDNVKLQQSQISEVTVRKLRAQLMNKLK